MVMIWERVEAGAALASLPAGANASDGPPRHGKAAASRGVHGRRRQIARGAGIGGRRKTGRKWAPAGGTEEDAGGFGSSVIGSDHLRHWVWVGIPLGGGESGISPAAGRASGRSVLRRRDRQEWCESMRSG